MNYHYENKYGEANTNITSDVIEELPFVVGEHRTDIIKKTRDMLTLNQEFYEKNKKFLQKIFFL